MGTKKKKPLDSMSRQIEFKYHQSNLYRVIKADGAWGGILPQGFIQMSVFSEVKPLPQFEIYEIQDDDKARPVKGSKERFVAREIEASLILTPAVARSLGEWLLEKVRQYEELIVDQDDSVILETANTVSEDEK